MPSIATAFGNDKGVVEGAIRWTGLSGIGGVAVRLVLGAATSTSSAIGPALRAQ